jgi:predicted transcriptional regulator
METDDRVSTSVVLSRDTYERLRRVAFELHEPQTRIVETALVRLLPELEERIETVTPAGRRR